MTESTQTVSVRCNHCGAPLQVASGARFITCTYCGSSLEIHRTGGALYTEVLGDIDQRTQRIEQDVAAIKRQNEIEALDREWDIRRQSFLVRNKDGSTDVPSVAGGVIAAVIAIVAGIAWMIFTASAGAPGFFPLFGLLFIVVGVVGAIRSMGAASGYHGAEREYQLRRAQLLQADQNPNTSGQK